MLGNNKETLQDIMLLLNSDNYLEAASKLTNPNVQILNGNNILHIAAIRGKEKNIYELLSLTNINIFYTNDKGNTCFHLLFINGWDKIGIDLVTKYSKSLIKINNLNQQIAFMCMNRIDTFKQIINLMIINNCLSVLDYEYLLNRGNFYQHLLLKCKNDKKYKQIMMDILNNHKPSINLLTIFTKINDHELFNEFINHDEKYAKSYVNKIDDNELTGLIYAIINKNYEISKTLLGLGANPNYGLYDNSKLPLNLSIYKCLDNITILLLENGADPDVTDLYKNTPLHYLIEKVNAKKTPLRILLLALSKSKNINIPNYKNNTIIHLLSKYSLISYTFDAIKHKQPDFTIKNLHNQTPYNYLDENEKKILINNNVQIADNTILHVINDKTERDIFSSDPIHNLIYTLYILNKYDSLTIPNQELIKSKRLMDFVMMYINDIYMNEYSKRILSVIRNLTQIGYIILPHYVLWYDKNIHYINPYFELYFAKALNNDKRFVYVKITRVFSGTMHANCLLYDKILNVVTRFEPYGYIIQASCKTSNCNDELDDTLHKLIDNIVFKYKKVHIKYESPNVYMKDIKPQLFSDDTNSLNLKLTDPEGYCLAWSFWFIELKLSNPDVDNKTLLSKEFNNLANGYLIYIRNYSKLLIDAKKEIMMNMGFKNNDFFNREYTMQQLKVIVNYLSENIRKKLK